MPRRATSRPSAPSSTAAPGTVRIIGGVWRGRKLPYSGDPRTRPMKDRVREAIFNLLAEAVVGRHALDLFAGTGALAIEAVSRGAVRATLFERHFPTVRLVERSLAELGAADRVRVVAGDSFFSLREFAPADATPWLVFCSPPYEFFASRPADMDALIADIQQRAPPGSLLVVEGDDRWPVDDRSDRDAWDLRTYPPAVIGIWRKPG